jgi:type I restriction enzyme R subunit
VSQDEDFVIKLHDKIMAVKLDKWRGDRVKERVILRGIHTLINDENEVDAVFDIVKEQREYW